MDIIETKCVESPVIHAGETFSGFIANVTLEYVIDTNNAVITVDPRNEAKKTFPVKQGGVYDMTDCRVKVDTIFHGTASDILQITLCEITEAVPLHVSDIQIVSTEPPAIKITVEGADYGTMKINWGDVTVTTHNNIRAGVYQYSKTLPVGTHVICVDIV